MLFATAPDARPRGPLGRDEEEEGLLDVLAEGHTLDRKFDTSEEAHILSLVPEAGREVALSKVVEQGHEASRSLATGDTFDAHHVGTGGLADKKARAGKPHTHRVGVLTGDRHPFVDDRLVQDRGDDILRTERLEAFDPGEHLWEHTNEADRGVVLLQPSPQARHCTSRPDTGNDMGEPASSLLEDLDSRRLV